jgi:cytochrome b
LTAGVNRKQEKVMSTLHETILEQTAIISALIIAAMPTIAAIASMF